MRPGAVVDLMARAELAELAAARMGIARSYSIDRREVTSLFSEDAAEADSTARKFFGEFDEILSFFAFDDAAYRRGLERASGGALTFHRFRPPGEGHIAELYLRSIGAPACPVESRIDLTPGDRKSAHDILARVGVAPRKFVILLPGSGSTRKNWSAERFVALARIVEKDLAMRALAILGPAEDTLAPIFQRTGLVILTGLPLASVAALCAVAAAFVGNDSGVSHLAAAAGAKGVVIFGPTDPSRWRPVGQVRTLQTANLAALTVDQVARALEETLQSIKS